MSAAEIFYSIVKSFPSLCPSLFWSKNEMWYNISTFLPIKGKLDSKQILQVKLLLKDTNKNNFNLLRQNQYGQNKFYQILKYIFWYIYFSFTLLITLALYYTEIKMRASNNLESLFLLKKLNSLIYSFLLIP